MVSRHVGTRLDTGWRLFSSAKGGKGAGWHFWCNTAIKRNSFADPMSPALSLLGKEPHGSRVRGAGRTRAGPSLYFSPKVQSCASPGGCLGQGRVRPVWLQRQAVGQGPRPKRLVGGTLVAAVSGLHWQKLLSWIEPWPGVGGILLHALFSQHKRSFFLGGPRAQEASLGHGAVQPKNVRDLHLRDCALSIVGLYLLGGG